MPDCHRHEQKVYLFRPRYYFLFVRLSVMPDISHDTIQYDSTDIRKQQNVPHRWVQQTFTVVSLHDI